MAINYDNEYPKLQRKCAEQQAEIERLQSKLTQAQQAEQGAVLEIERLRSALGGAITAMENAHDWIKKNGGFGFGPVYLERAIEIAREALRDE